MHAYLSRLDYKVFSAFNSLAGHRATDWFFILCAVYFAYIIPLILLGWWFANKDRITARKAIIMAALSALAAREIVKPIIAALWTRNRPFIAHTVHDIISKKDNEASFPSGHAIAMFSIAAAVYHYNKKMGIALYVLAILTGISRVVVGVHYPSDIIGGAVLGILTAWVIVKLLDKKLNHFSEQISALSDKILPFTKER